MTADSNGIGQDALKMDNPYGLLVKTCHYALLGYSMIIFRFLWYGILETVFLSRFSPIHLKLHMSVNLSPGTSSMKRIDHVNTAPVYMEIPVLHLVLSESGVRC